VTPARTAPGFRRIRAARMGRRWGLGAAVLAVGFGATACRRAATEAESRADAWTAQLRNEKPEKRREAAEALGRLRHKPATARLIRALADSNGDVRIAAADALGALEAVEAVEPLARTAGGGGEWPQRKAAMVALGRIATTNAVPHLTRGLSDGNAAVAIAAAMGLANAGERGAASLVAGAAHPSATARRAAALGLANRRTDAAAAVLRQLLSDPDVGVRLETMEILHRRRDPAATAAFLALLDDHEEMVRERAAARLVESVGPGDSRLEKAVEEGTAPARRALLRVLVRSRDPAAMPALLMGYADADATVRRIPAQLLEDRLAGPALTGALVGALRHGDARVRRQAVTLLEPRANAGLVEAVLPLMEEADPESRLVAARIVQKHGGEGMARRFKPLMEDADARIRQVAAAALIGAGDQRACDVLLQALAAGAARGDGPSADPQTVLAVRMLGEARDARAVEPLLALLERKNGEIVTAAVTALGLVGDPRAFERVAALIGHADGSIRAAAALAVGRLRHERSFARLSAAIEEAWRKAGGDEAPPSASYRAIEWLLPAFGALGDPRALDILLPRLQVRSGPREGDHVTLHRIRAVIGPLQAMVDALAEIGDPRAADPIRQRIRLSLEIDSTFERRLRLTCIRALLRLEPAKATETLLDALRQEPDYRPDMVEDLCAMLASHDDPRAISVLADRIGSDVPAVRKAALDALRARGAPAVEGLMRRLDDERGGRRAVTAAALAAICETATEPLIAGLAQESPRIRQGCAWALGQTQSPAAVEALIARLADADAGVRGAAAWALGEQKDARAVEPLAARFRDPQSAVREGAVQALGEIADERAVEALAQAATNEWASVRVSAATALGKRGGERARSALGRLLKDPDRRVGDAARTSLTGLKNLPCPEEP
jgi:HEAT repeat protein